jgi:hypothetical protein
MATISVSLPSDGSTADVADVNTPINTIVTEINGNLDNANIKSGAAISGSKIADASIDLGSKGSTFDGWIAVSDSWAYASATTITVPSDATTKYSVGDKIKIVQSATTKYFYITAVSSTVLTVTGGTDYTVANSAISGVYYSKAATPQGFPQWFNYTPSLVGWSGTPTIAFARFNMIGKHVTTIISITGTSNSGTTTATTPVTSTAAHYEGNTGLCRNNGALDIAPARVYLADANTFQVARLAGTGAWTASGTKEVRFVAIYEAA